MDPRSSKAQDFVAITRNLDEEVHKGRRLRLKWFQQYEWLLDEKKCVLRTGPLESYQFSTLNNY